jgi:iron(III) transport system substrate-binding protein
VRRWWTFVPITLVVAVVVGGCGSTPGKGSQAKHRPVPAAVTAALKTHGAARASALRALAAKEGNRVVLYTSVSSLVADELVKAFTRDTGIAVTLYRADSGAVTQRALQEGRAGAHASDVVELHALDVPTLDTAGLIVAHPVDAPGALVAGAAQHHWTQSRLITYAVSWNSKLVAPGAQPTRWEDLADPKWKGRLGMEIEDAPWFKTLWQYWSRHDHRSDADIARTFAQMASNALTFTGHTTMGQIMGSGEIEVATSQYTYVVDTLSKKGAPLAWKPAVAPVITFSGGIAVSVDAPHPATAHLFIDWFLANGQDVLRAGGLNPIRRDITQALPTDGLTVDVDDFIAHRKEWSDRYDQLLRQAKPRSNG